MNDELIVHRNLVLADKNGACHGGHLAEGSKVFVAEVHLRELPPSQ
jgi:predicted DNA-binding protein with PD1-like motif